MHSLYTRQNLDFLSVNDDGADFFCIQKGDKNPYLTLSNNCKFSRNCKRSGLSLFATERRREKDTQSLNSFVGLLSTPVARPLPPLYISKPTQHSAGAASSICTVFLSTYSRQ